jgi:hypothetical protein
MNYKPEIESVMCGGQIIVAIEQKFFPLSEPLRDTINEKNPVKSGFIKTNPPHPL